MTLVLKKIEAKNPAQRFLSDDNFFLVNYVDPMAVVACLTEAIDPL